MKEVRHQLQGNTMTQHVTLDFGPIKVPAETFHSADGVWVFKLDTMNAACVVEHMSGQQLVDIAKVGDTVILNQWGSFLQATDSGYLVTIVVADFKTEASMINEEDFDHLNAFAQCHLEKRKCPIEKLNSLPGNPSPQSLGIISYGTKLNNKYGITGEIHGLKPTDIVNQVIHHAMRNQSYQIVANGLFGN
jgi:hypothetical protein